MLSHINSDNVYIIYCFLPTWILFYKNIIMPPSYLKAQETTFVDVFSPVTGRRVSHMIWVLLFGCLWLVAMKVMFKRRRGVVCPRRRYSSLLGRW